MARQKIIYWRPDMNTDKKGQIYANVHLLIGYCGTAITDFMEMADELRKTFPQANNDEIGCGKVFRSNQFNGFTIITWSEYIPKGDYPGWDQVDDGRIEYVW